MGYYKNWTIEKHIEKRNLVQSIVERNINSNSIEKYVLDFIPNEQPNKQKWAMYKKDVWIKTESISHLIPQIETRGFRANHIDHIVPVSFGFKHNIPIEAIASLDNLRMIHYKENMNKGIRITEEAIMLLKKWS